MSFFFLWGASLPDPNKRLKGSGKQARHLIIEGIEVPEAAKIVIKPVSAKQRPRRPPAKNGDTMRR